jgi:hypothetical protein
VKEGMVEVKEVVGKGWEGDEVGMEGMEGVTGTSGLGYSHHQ